MALILRGHDMEAMYEIYEALNQDLAEAGLQDSLSADEPLELYHEDVTRSDAATLIDIVFKTAESMGTGGAITAATLAVLLSKETLLSKFAAILDKYLENRKDSQKVELLWEKDGEKIQLSGKGDNVEAILKQLKEK